MSIIWLLVLFFPLGKHSVVSAYRAKVSFSRDTIQTSTAKFVPKGEVTFVRKTGLNQVLRPRLPLNKRSKTDHLCGTANRSITQTNVWLQISLLVNIYRDGERGIRWGYILLFIASETIIRHQTHGWHRWFNVLKTLLSFTTRPPQSLHSVA